MTESQSVKSNIESTGVLTGGFLLLKFSVSLMSKT